MFIIISILLALSTNSVLKCIYDRLVEIAMEAMDLLLMACHAQTLNLFVESFLRMIQKLMEDANPNLQILATNSVNFVFFSHNNNYFQWKSLNVIE